MSGLNVFLPRELGLLPRSWNVRVGLDGIAVQATVVLLKETEKSIQGEEKLLVVVPPVPMVVVVPPAPRGESEWDDILRRPREVKAAVKLGKKKGDDHVVQAPSEWMDGEQIQRNDRESDFQNFLHQRQANNFSCTDFLHLVVL